MTELETLDTNCTSNNKKINNISQKRKRRKRLSQYITGQITGQKVIGKTNKKKKIHSAISLGAHTNKVLGHQKLCRQCLSDRKFLNYSQ